jgi:sarcosine oxidase subunit beta
MNTQTHLLIIGGGIFGASIAYYFKRDNPDKKVVVYESNELCSGNTSLAAALLSRVRTYKHVIPLSIETYKIIPELESVTATSIPVKYNGAIHIATDSTTEVNLEKMLNAATESGIDWEYISNNKSIQMVPWLDCSNIRKIAFIPGEAITDPYLIGMAFVNAAKRLGVEFRRHAEVNSIIRINNRVTGIITNGKVHEAENTVLAAGAWSVNLAFQIGIVLPMAPVRSQYWITEPAESISSPTAPTVIIPAAGYYSRPQGVSHLFGIREPNPLVIDSRLIPKEVNSFTFSTDEGWSDLITSYEKIVPFFRDFGDIRIKNYVAGFSCYTPDNQFIAGIVDGVDGILLATGCSGAGISVAGGIGLGVACLAGNKKNPFDFSNYSTTRFGQVDPFSKEHLNKCALARSIKTSG